MKNSIITKTIDDLGRIVLPKDMRRKLDMEIRTAVDLYIDDNRIIITKSYDECVFCGSKDDLMEFKGKYICKNCMETLK